MIACLAALLAIPLLAPVAPAAAVDDPVLAGARSFIVAQQQADGGFEVAASPSFETPDAILALGELAQTTPTWNAAAARQAVTSVVKAGKNPLDYADKQAQAAALGAGTAAKYIVLVARPLGVNPQDFDPSGDNALPVDLVAKMGAGADLDGQYRAPAFNALLYIALAQWARDCRVPDDLVARITAAQQANGSWSFTGDPSGTEVDIDTTGLAIVALTRAGRTASDPAMARGLSLLAHQQQGDGGWQAFGATNPNSTALAMLAVSATGQDPAGAAWRDAAAPDLVGRPYTSPDAWLRSHQGADGHIASPNDQYGVNTFATSQSVEALTRRWFTSKPASTTSCRLPGGPRERFLRAEFQTLTGRPGTVADLQPAANALGADPAPVAKRTAAVLTTMASAAHREEVTAELFQRVLHRSVDTAGRSFWSDRLRTVSRETVLSELAASQEFFSKAGGTDARFVDQLYLVALGRAAESAGRSYWVSQLVSGTSRQRVAALLASSEEGRRFEVRTQYRVVLGRDADLSGLSFWAAQLRTRSVEELVLSLVSSQEYLAQVTS